MTRIRMGLALGLLPALALALAACGGSDKPSGVASLGGTDKATSTTRAGGGDNRQAALNWARCMRQHGINMPDPKVDAAEGIGVVLPQGVNPDDPRFKAAQQACQQYANGGQPPKPNPQEQQQLVQFSRCMRQHGINMPDPNANGGIDMRGIGVDPDDPKFKAAQQACQQYQPNRDKQTQSNGGGA